MWPQEKRFYEWPDWSTYAWASPEFTNLRSTLIGPRYYTSPAGRRLTLDEFKSWLTEILIAKGFQRLVLRSTLVKCLDVHTHSVPLSRDADTNIIHLSLWLTDVFFRATVVTFWNVIIMSTTLATNTPDFLAQHLKKAREWKQQVVKIIFSAARSGGRLKIYSIMMRESRVKVA